MSLPETFNTITTGFQSLLEDILNLEFVKGRLLDEEVKIKKNV